MVFIHGLVVGGYMYLPLKMRQIKLELRMRIILNKLLTGENLVR